MFSFALPLWLVWSKPRRVPCMGRCGYPSMSPRRSCCGASFAAWGGETEHWVRWSFCACPTAFCSVPLRTGQISVDGPIRNMYQLRSGTEQPAVGLRKNKGAVPLEAFPGPYHTTISPKKKGGPARRAGDFLVTFCSHKKSPGAGQGAAAPTQADGGGAPLRHFPAADRRIIPLTVERVRGADTAGADKTAVYASGPGGEGAGQRRDPGAGLHQQN